MKPGIVLSLLIISASLMAYVGQSTDLPDTGYWAMEGTLIRHPFPDQRDSLSGQEIIELQDENGLSIWYSPEDLEIEIETDEPDAVDAYTSATLPTLSEVVVKASSENAYIRNLTNNHFNHQ